MGSMRGSTQMMMHAGLQMNDSSEFGGKSIDISNGVIKTQEKEPAV